eukprot:TRINITY_DN13789_c0_g1_i2.p1 TRINITY_DN13789_c0_g1~~TRINITY_DN13789_c0_g1_i2.p1  ORF type:complete len:840 (+),score=207.36 TRINITY_DN13789_c0_g1_i2:95-2614(+)
MTPPGPLAAAAAERSAAAEQPAAPPAERRTDPAAGDPPAEATAGVAADAPRAEGGAGAAADGGGELSAHAGAFTADAGGGTDGAHSSRASRAPPAGAHDLAGTPDREDKDQDDNHSSTASRPPPVLCVVHPQTPRASMVPCPPILGSPKGPPPAGLRLAGYHSPRSPPGPGQRPLRQPPPPLAGQRPAAPAPHRAAASAVSRSQSGGPARPLTGPTDSGRLLRLPSLERLASRLVRGQPAAPGAEAGRRGGGAAQGGVRPFTHFFAARKKDGGEPCVFLSYPLPADAFLAEHPRVVQFCYPEEPCSSDGTAAARFSFTMTDAQGHWLHGFVLRCSAEQCFCLLSPFPWFRLFDEVLAHAARQHAEGGQPGAVYELYRTAVPSHAVKVAIAPGATVRFEVRRSPEHAQYPLVEAGLTELCAALTVPRTLRLLCCVLEERRILFLHDDIGRLASAAHALAAMLTPMRWPHTFVPVLPASMLEHVCAPTPYIIGVHSSSLPRLRSLPMEETVVADLRRGELSGVPPDLLELPNQGRLKEALLGVMRADASGRPTRRAHAELLDALTAWFAGIFAPLLLFGVRVLDERGKQITVCDYDAFDGIVQGRHRTFAQRLRRTAMFQLWVQDGIRGPGRGADAFGRHAAHLLPGGNSGVLTRLAGRLPDGLRLRLAEAAARAAQRLPPGARPGSPDLRLLGPRGSVDAEGTPVQRGQTVAVRCRDGRTRGCTVVSVRQGAGGVYEAKVHYDGLPSSSDEWIPTDSDRITVVLSPGPSSPPASSPVTETGLMELGAKVAVHRDGRWLGCTVIRVDPPRVLVHYDGWDLEPEWVELGSGRLVAGISSCPA